MTRRTVVADSPVEQLVIEAVKRALKTRGWSERRLARELKAAHPDSSLDSAAMSLLLNGRRRWSLVDYSRISEVLGVNLMDPDVKHTFNCLPLHELSTRLVALMYEVRDLSGDVEAAMAAYMPDAPSPAAALNLTRDRAGLLGWAWDGRDAEVPA